MIVLISDVLCCIALRCPVARVRYWVVLLMMMLPCLITDCCVCNRCSMIYIVVPRRVLMLLLECFRAE